ncbi:hypothetical protein [Sphingopyxis solisilvae]|uniref:hypothetical protein n=1 Tax=Sphingopyxis solisilvae TaxID=1886788 RepID=UPI001892BC5F|nr:hypothetical protein [Sphingopyxis solisilvae]
MTAKTILAPLVLAVCGQALPVAATLPPPPPVEYGAYGPLAVCEGELRIAVAEDEALHIVGPIFRIINDDYLIAATPMLLPHQTLGAVTGGVSGSMIALPGPIMVFRYSGELTADTARYVPYAPEGFGAASVRYAVQSRTVTASTDMIPVLVIASPSFDGTDADRAILARVTDGDSDATDCFRPADGMADPKAAGLVSAFDDPRYPGLYPRRPDVGPGFYCRDGVGFAVRPGEQLHRPWRSQRRGHSFLLADGAMVTMEGADTPMRRADPASATDHPAGLLHQSRLIFYPGRGVEPPYAPPAVHEEGSWEVDLGRDRGNSLRFRFPAGDKAHIGFGLIERLEFVAPDDPRCGATGR